MKASVAALLAAGARLISSGTGAPCPARPAMPQAYGKQRLDNASRPHPLHGPAATRSRTHLDILKILGLFIATALAEIVGCYLPYLWLRQERSAWLLLPAALSLALFAWLLTLHPQAAGRVYAAYGGVYISVALMWLWAVDSVRPTLTYWVCVGIGLTSMGMFMLGAWHD